MSPLFLHVSQLAAKHGAKSPSAQIHDIVEMAQQNWLLITPIVILLLTITYLGYKFVTSTDIATYGTIEANDPSKKRKDGQS